MQEKPFSIPSAHRIRKSCGISQSPLLHSCCYHSTTFLRAVLRAIRENLIYLLLCVSFLKTRRVSNAAIAVAVVQFFRWFDGEISSITFSVA